MFSKSALSLLILTSTLTPAAYASPIPCGDKEIVVEQIDVTIVQPPPPVIIREQITEVIEVIPVGARYIDALDNSSPGAIIRPDVGKLEAALPLPIVFQKRSEEGGATTPSSDTDSTHTSSSSPSKATVATVAAAAAAATPTTTSSAGTSTSTATSTDTDDTADSPTHTAIIVPVVPAVEGHTLTVTALLGRGLSWWTRLVVHLHWFS